MTFYIETLGCKVNAYESEIMRELLLEAGYGLAESIQSADVMIIHTCSVTNMADSKSRKLIRAARRENEHGILVVCGCSAQNHQEALLDLGIDILIGNKDKSKIVELIESYQKDGKRIVRFYPNQKLPFEDMTVCQFGNHTRAYLKVQDGCNNYCAYCIIPYLRGNLRSKDFDQAIGEASSLVKAGHQEIVLTGIHTGTYGVGTEHDLVDLIEEMSKITGLKRIRISSIEVVELKEHFMKLLRENGKVCHHLHIPLQAGCDKTLSSMNRRYDTAMYENIIREIRSIVPDISITTDVIVGFPGETEEDFMETYQFCKRIGFAKIHVFPYSVRTGTKAAEMPNQVDASVKKERAHRLLALSDALERDYASKFVGRTLDVLIEEVKNEKSYGHTSNYLEVELDGELPRNTFVSVTILQVKDGCVKGLLAKNVEHDIMRIGE